MENLSNLLIRFWRGFSQRRRRQFVLLLGLMLVSAFAEVVSVGAVLPFLGILIAPDRVFNLPIVMEAARAWGVTSPDQLVLPLTVVFSAAALAAGAIRIFFSWVSTRFTFASGADLSMDLYRRTLYQPYWVHVTRNSSEVISGITNKVGSVVYVLSQVLTLISSGVLLVAILLTLLVIHPVVALVAAVCFGGSYGLIAWVSRLSLRRNSQRIASEQTQVIKVLQEGLGGIRDVLLDGTQSVYCEAYRHADRLFRRAQGHNVFIGAYPRPAMEALGITLIAALAYGLSVQPGGLAIALPVLGALALGAQRLLPALQQSYGAWVAIVGNHAALADIAKMLDQPLAPEVLEPAPAPLEFKETVCFDSLCFRFSSDGPMVLNDISLTIPKGARLGIVGTTGGGKSTMLDVLMGLLLPTKGKILVDGQVVSDRRLRAWQRTIAHVPQNIFLADTSLAENIAFGVPREAIDLQKAQRAARQAQIADFIESRPQAYEACVGERGIRLSGGQRQRIGIARALYKQASVLVFDEATSALDNATEQSVMDAINGLDRDLTVLIVAHRLSTVQRCDMIVQLEQGRVVAKGPYDQLVASSASFRQMVAGNVLVR